MNTQEILDQVKARGFSQDGLVSLVEQFCKALNEARAEARHLAEYEESYKVTLVELRQAHARGDANALQAEQLYKELKALQEKCKYFLKADAWVRAKIEKFLPL